MLANKFLKPKNQFRNKGSMKFSTKEYSNPFFENKKKFKNFSFINFEFSRRLKLIFYSLALVIAILIASAFYSGYFNIKNINIKGEGGINADDIRSLISSQLDQKYFKILPQKIIFFFNSSSLKNNLETKYVFDSLNIKKDFPNTLQVIFKEKTYAFILKEDEKYFYADKEGIVIDEVNPIDVSLKAYPVIKNESQDKTQNGKTGFAGKYISFVLQLFSEIKKYPEDFKIDSFIVDNDMNTVKVALDGGPKIYFNTDNTIEGQMNKLIILKKEKLKDTFAKKEYIDLRYGDSIYYR
jgi:cell division septal protein FtsQ